MVLTRSQSKLLAERGANNTPIQSKSIPIHKEFTNNIKSMLNDYEEQKKIEKNKKPIECVTDNMKICLNMYEYINKMLHHFKDNKRFEIFIRCIYEKSLEFEQEHKKGVYDEIPYKLVCDFLASIKKSQHLIVNDLQIKV